MMLKRTALYEEHLKLAGRMVDFGGWELPVQYTGVRDEHIACRTTAGLFDVSHMGEFTLTGIDAEAFLNYAVTNDVTRLCNGQAQYTAMCNEQGGIVDDLVIYRKTKEDFFLVVNASNTEKDFNHLSLLKQKFKGGLAKCALENLSHDYSQIAIQGPLAATILQKITQTALFEIKTYHFVSGLLLGDIPTLIARTGYTGEDGFELYVPWNQGPAVWRALLQADATHSMKPCGLGARDTLRLEMKYPLYGHELTDDTLPLETALNWVTPLSKPDFFGKSALIRAKEKGIDRCLIGFKMKGRGIPRQGYSVFASDRITKIGAVTSGTQSPSVGEAIGIALIARSHQAIGTPLLIEIRNNLHEAEVTPTPFYKKEKIT